MRSRLAAEAFKMTGPGSHFQKAANLIWEISTLKPEALKKRTHTTNPKIQKHMHMLTAPTTPDRPRLDGPSCGSVNPLDQSEARRPCLIPRARWATMLLSPSSKASSGSFGGPGPWAVAGLACCDPCNSSRVSQSREMLRLGIWRAGPAGLPVPGRRVQPQHRFRSSRIRVKKVLSLRHW